MALRLVDDGVLGADRVELKRLTGVDPVPALAKALTPEIDALLAPVDLASPLDD
jgi:hypothetical protein